MTRQELLLNSGTRFPQVVCSIHLPFGNGSIPPGTVGQITAIHATTHYCRCEIRFSHQTRCFNFEEGYRLGAEQLCKMDDLLIVQEAIYFCCDDGEAFILWPGKQLEDKIKLDNPIADKNSGDKVIHNYHFMTPLLFGTGEQIGISIPINERYKIVHNGTTIFPGR